MGTDADPGREVLADLLVIASEAGPDRLVTTDRLLREIVGPDAVNAAHREWTDRIRGAVLGESDGARRPRHGASPGHDLPTTGASGDTLELLQAIRATAPAPGAGSA